VEPSNHSGPLSGLFNTTSEVSSPDVAVTNREHPVVRFDFGYYYAPTAKPISVSTNCGTPVPVSLLTTDAYPDPSLLSIVSAGPASNGTVVVSADHRSLTYTPNAGCTTDSFPYTISGIQGSTASSTVSVTVNPNQAPIANPDSASIVAGVATDISVLTNDSDPDGSPLIVTSLSTPSHGTATLNADGSIHYMPAVGYYGPDSFTYGLTDACGAAGTTVVTLMVEPPPPPVVPNVPAGDGRKGPA